MYKFQAVSNFQGCFNLTVDQKRENCNFTSFLRLKSDFELFFSILLMRKINGNLSLCMPEQVSNSTALQKITVPIYFS